MARAARAPREAHDGAAGRDGAALPRPPHARPARGRAAQADGDRVARQRCAAELEELAADYGTDELLVVTVTYDHEARRRSYELLAEAFGLAPLRVPHPGTQAPAADGGSNR